MLWKTVTDRFNCVPVVAIIDKHMLCSHGGLSSHFQSMEQIRRIMRPTDVPDAIISIMVRPGSRYNSPWSKKIIFVLLTHSAHPLLHASSTNTISISSAEYTRSLKMSTEFFVNRQLVTLFFAPNYCNEFDDAGALISVDKILVCFFQNSNSRTITLSLW